MKFEDIEVKGVTFSVDVNVKGQFTTVVECSVVAADSLQALKEKLAKRLAKESVKVSIPFCRWDDDDYDRKLGRLRKGVITGIHSANNNILIKWEDQEKGEQDSHWSHADYLYPNVADEYAILCTAAYEAKAAKEAFERKHKFDAKARIKEELAKALGKEKAAEIVS